jgi:glycosyltransferase involved in cell wall biosynthesis
MKNEEDIISDCLTGLKFANEIIVLDQGSTDKSVAIAKKFTNKVYETSIEDFATNRTKLKELATNDWILYVDADERIGPGLISEINKVIKEDKFSYFYIPRKNFVLGKRIKHGGWWPDFAPRLFKKNDLIKWEGKIHESPLVKGQSANFKNALEHFTARTVTLMLNKSIRWAKIEAELYHKHNNPKVTILKVIKASSTEFIYRYIIKKAFLDGTIGLIESIFQALHKAMIFIYLWEIQNQVYEKFSKEARQTQ